MRRARKLFTAPDERGAALLSVLLLVAIMSTLAVAILEEVRFAAQRTANSALRDQARWYALGAEELAKTVVLRSFLESRGVTTDTEPWARGVTRFPLDVGYIDGVVSDASNCFNLNAVVVDDGVGRYTLREKGADQLARLLDGARVDAVDPQVVVSALVDWIDADAQPSGAGGAEDFTYAGADVPRHTPNTLVRDETELRGLSGVSADAYAQIRPYVCARPTTAPSRLNVNTLTPAHAPLLAAVYGELLSVEAARAVIEARPRGGYDTIEEFLTQDGLEAFEATDDMLAQLDVKAAYFSYEAQVVIDDAYVAQSGLLHQDPDGLVRVVRRQYGPAS